jgi:hypothetical protein
MRGAIVIFALGASALLASASTLRSAELGDILDAYNSRDFGSPGFEEVDLTVQAIDGALKQYRLQRAWMVSAAGAITVARIIQPAPLAGVSYRLAQARAGQIGDIDLFLPAGSRQVMQVSPSRIFEGLLGSHFSYADLMWFFPTFGNSFVLRSSGLDGLPIVASKDVQSLKWEEVDYRLSADRTLVIGTDYYARQSHQLGRRITVESSTCLVGVNAPTKIISADSDGSRSILTLVRARYHADQATLDAFEPERIVNLSRLMDDLRSASTPVYQNQGISSCDG